MNQKDLLKLLTQQAQMKLHLKPISAIEEEAKYDSLYAVYTNLEDDVENIIKINHSRWEIEVSFRIMKSEFNANPVFHSM